MNKKSNLHSRYGQSKSAGERIAKNVGENHATGKLLVEMAKSLNLNVVEVRPTRKKKNSEEFNRITGWVGRSNQEQRDAAMQVIETALSDDEEIEHADHDVEGVSAVFDTLNDLQRQAVYTVIAGSLDDEEFEMEHSDTAVENGETIPEIFNTLNEKQKNVVYAMIGMVVSGEGGNKDMKHNVFEACRELRR